MKKLSDIFGGKVPGLNAPISLKSGVDKLEMKMNMNISPEKIGWGRLNQQKKLSLFGDKDKDKVMNILDCNPTNKNEQGFIHKTLNLVRGRGFRENEDVQLRRDFEQARQIYAPRRTEQPVTVVARPVPRELEGPTFGQKLATGATNVLKGAGIIKSEQERMALAKEKTQRMKLRQQVEIERLKAMPRITDRRPYSGLGKTGQVIRAGEQSLGEFGIDLSRASIAVQPVSEIDKINRLVGMGGSGAGIMSMSRTGVEKSFNLKIAETVGTQEDIERAKEQMAQQSVPIAPQQQIPSQQPVQRYPEQSYETLLYSPYSKRKVTYTRGPYRKRIPVPQQRY